MQCQDLAVVHDLFRILQRVAGDIELMHFPGAADVRVAGGTRGKRMMLVPALDLLFRLVAERMGTIVLSALVAHTAWHWMAERFERLRQFSFQGPAFPAALLANTVRGLLLFVIVASIVWLVRGRLVSPSSPPDEGTPLRTDE